MSTKMRHLKAGDAAPSFEFADHEGKRRSLAEFAGRPVALVFMRYGGCPICQLEASRLGRRAADFRKKGAALLVAIQSGSENAWRIAEFIPGATLVCDPEGEVYRLYGVPVGTLLQYASPAALAKAREAAAVGYQHGPKEGKERQLPAGFVIGGDGIVVYARYGRNIADTPSPEELLSALEGGEDQERA